MENALAETEKFPVLVRLDRQADRGQHLRGVGAYDITNDRPTERTLTTADAAPLLDGAIVAHAHVSAHIEHRINGILIANGALGTGVGALLIAETVLPLGAVQRAGALCNWL